VKKVKKMVNLHHTLLLYVYLVLVVSNHRRGVCSLITPYFVLSGLLGIGGLKSWKKRVGD